MREKQIKIQVHPNHMGITIMGDQNVSLRNTSLWHKDYFEQKTNEKGQTQKSSPSSPDSQSPETTLDSFQLRDGTKRNVYDKPY